MHSDPNEVRARAPNGPRPINHRHENFQSNPPCPAGTYSPGQSGLIFSNSPQSGGRATKGRMLLWSKPRGQYRYSNSVASTFCRIGSFLRSRPTLESSFS